MFDPLRAHEGRPTLRLPQEEKILRFTKMRDPEPDISPPNRDWLLSLAQALQKSLRLDELVQTFSEHVRAVVRHDSAEFRPESDAGKEPVVVGTPAEHSCAYRISLPGESIGTIVLTRSTPFSGPETTVIENLVLNLVYPLRNALLYERALEVAAQDTLTGLGNRASLDATLEREIASANRHREPLSVIMVDVDHFKRVNDRHGHVAGDVVLRSLAACIAECIRDSDVAFRYGGEEFVIILSKTGLEGARNLADRLRVRIEESEIALPESRIRVTASLGIAVMGPEDTGTHLLENADTALYRSKKAGRNRVSWSDEEGIGTAPDLPSASTVGD